MDSKLTVRNLDNNTGIAVSNESNARRFALNTLSTGGWTAYDGGGGVWNQGLRQTNGNVGIGTTPTTDRLVVGRTDSGIVANPPAAASFFVNNTSSVSPAVKAEVNTIFGNFGAAAIFAISSGTGGFGGLFYASNAAGNGPALIALSDGNGNGITANSNGGNGLEANIEENGIAVYGWVPTFATGRAARFAIFSDTNANPSVTISTAGTGSGVLVNHTGSSGNIASSRTAAPTLHGSTRPAGGSSTTARSLAERIWPRRSAWSVPSTPMHREMFWKYPRIMREHSARAPAPIRRASSAYMRRGLVCC